MATLNENSELEILLIVKNVPTPDYKKCELKIPTLQITNSNFQKVLF